MRLRCEELLGANTSKLKNGRFMFNNLSIQPCQGIRLEWVMAKDGSHLSAIGSGSYSTVWLANVVMS